MLSIVFPAKIDSLVPTTTPRAARSPAGREPVVRFDEHEPRDTQLNHCTNPCVWIPMSSKNCFVAW